MTWHDLLLHIQNSPPALLISKSDHLVGAGLQVLHILGFTAVLASSLFIGLRASGAVLAQQPLRNLTPDIRRLLWWGLGAATFSGVAMFISAPVLYAGKPVFFVKLLIYGIALFAQALVLFSVSKGQPERRAGRHFIFFISLLLWLSVAVAGRAIGFV